MYLVNKTLGLASLHDFLSV